MDTKLIEGLAILVLLSFVIERALAVIFDTEKLRDIIKKWDLKPWTAIAVSVTVCGFLQFDILHIFAETAPNSVQADNIPSWLGILITGLTVAGGSAGAVKLFQDVLGFRRTTREEQRRASEAEQAALVAEAEARQAIANAQKQAATLQAAAPTGTILGAQLDRERVLANRFYEIASGQKM